MHGPLSHLHASMVCCVRTIGLLVCAALDVYATDMLIGSRLLLRLSQVSWRNEVAMRCDISTLGLCEREDGALRSTYSALLLLFSPMSSTATMCPMWVRSCTRTSDHRCHIHHHLYCPRITITQPLLLRGTMAMYGTTAT